ncbi:hypothetical protein EJD97_002703 [Solanum chilense]|uniref:Integrase zinc-binding domain-containing protein n=1 Tax=Solanum chilense TaxID=4083 RepID=A0A6N2C2W3_SOLCI|nr:hypothetical protein EJD97_002703 [Solanum chilense]
MSKIEQYPQEFIDEIYKILYAMGLCNIEKAELATYQLKDVAQALREAIVVDFVNLRQGRMSLLQYFLKFTKLSKCGPSLVSDPRDEIGRFVIGVLDDEKEDCHLAMIHENLNISRLMVHAQHIDNARAKRKIRDAKRARSFDGGSSKVRVQDLDSEIPSINVFPIVREFLEVFPNDLLSIPPEWENNLGIDLLPNTNNILIPPYRMALEKVKDLKVQLKYLLDKGFITPSISPWGARILLVKKKDGEGVEVDPRKTEVVKNLPRPLTSTNIRSFLGLACYYHSVSHIDEAMKELVKDVHRLSRLRLRLEDSLNGVYMVHHKFESSIVIQVKSKQHLDKSLMQLKDSILGMLNDSSSLVEDCVLRYQRRLCDPNVNGLRNQILEEDHGSRYSIHSGSTKMYHHLREVFWLTKSDYFNPIKSTCSVEDYARIFINGIVCHRGIPLLSYPTEVLNSNIGFGGHSKKRWVLRQVKKLRSKEVASVKVLWKSHLVEGATWEAEADMNSHYHHLFNN